MKLLLKVGMAFSLIVLAWVLVIGGNAIVITALVMKKMPIAPGTELAAATWAMGEAYRLYTLFTWVVLSFYLSDKAFRLADGRK